MSALAGVVGGVGFAGIQDLKAADLFGDSDEALGVLKEQAGAFVGGNAAGEAEREDVGVEVVAGALSDGSEEAQFALVVSGGYACRIDTVDRAEVVIVGAPVGDLAVEEILELWREPGRGVDAVGDGVDLVLGEHFLRDLAVLHGDAVDEAREAQGDVGHVHEAVVKTAELIDGGGAIMTEDLVHLIDTELIVACRHGGVGGEDALLADGVDVGFGRVAERPAVEMLFEETDGEQGCVALVHVVDLRACSRGRRSRATPPRPRTVS